jgi:integrase
MAKSNSKKGRRKAGPAQPKDPFPDFPLGASTAGWWVKRIRGKLHYFGPWYKVRNGQIERLPDDGWQAALELYNAQKEDLHAGRIPRVKKIGGEGLTVGELRGRFLTAKSRALDAGEITRSTYFEYRQIADLLMAAFGEKRPVDDLAADDFSALRADLAKRWGPIRLGNGIVRVKSIFKYAFEQGLIDKPMRYGAEFKPPSASVKRRHRAKNGERMIEADEIRRLLDAADPALRAMVLLGVNCGFNNKDCADLPLKALDLKAGWLDFPRPKTGVKRRCPLWPETVEALRAATAARPEPREPDAEPLVFVTTRGRPWLSHGQANPVSVTARDAMKAVGIHHEGIGFATLRHVFRTVADGCRDQVAINHIMGHSDPTMGAVYRERIDDSRLRAVADYVRRRVWPDRVQ